MQVLCLKQTGCEGSYKGSGRICLLGELALSCPGHSFLLGDRVRRHFMLPGGGLMCGTLSGLSLSEGFTLED